MIAVRRSKKLNVIYIVHVQQLCLLISKAGHYVALSKVVDTPVNGRTSLFRIGDFSFPRFVGLLILSLWFYRLSGTQMFVLRGIERPTSGQMGEYSDHCAKSSSSAYYSPLLDIGLSNVSPSRSIFGYSHPAPARRQIDRGLI
jgi:hypothetical protein